MNFYAAKARDRAKCAGNAGGNSEFVLDIYETVWALRQSLQANESNRDQQAACTAILSACRTQLGGRLRVVAESKDDGWTLRDIDAAEVPGAQWGGKSDAD